MTEPYGRRFSIATDDSNRVIQLQDVQGRTLSYSYEDNRLTGVDYIAADQQASYAYSDAGLLNQVDDSASPYHQQIALSYDAQQRVTGYTENPRRAQRCPPAPGHAQLS